MSERGAKRVARQAPGHPRPWAGLALVACLGFGIAACGGGGAQTGFVATNPPPRPLRSRAVAEVALIEAQADAQAGGQAQARPLVEVGLIEVLGERGWSAADQAAARAALRRRAAEIGCDAVALLGEIDWIYTVESARSSRVRHGYRGVCIVYP
ncbi:MAG TPA: hypothetical protein VNM90_10445 [Haliangium sp.]|nr:hypothetical protein [Haliangium sp.]